MKRKVTKFELLDLLHKGEVNFTYIKKDGTTRTARGTLKGSIIDSHYSSKGGDNKVKGAGYNSYFDLDKNWFRCFNPDSVLEVIE